MAERARIYGAIAIDTLRPRHPRVGRIVVLACLVLYLVAAVVVFTVGDGRLRYTADSDDTQTVWAVWGPVLVGIILTRLVPPKAELPAPWLGPRRHRLHRQTWILVAAAVLFPALLAFVGHEDPLFQLWYLSSKLILLLVVPLIVLRAVGTEGTVAAPRPARSAALRWLAPVAAVVAWVTVHLASTAELESDPGPVPDLVTVLVVFLTASVLEEVFYRVWLQTRLEILLGRWPAIALAAVLWSLWHPVIQGSDNVLVDLANALTYQGVDGLFLGYLWSRYRNVWMLIVVHGVINAPVAQLLNGG